MANFHTQEDAVDGGYFFASETRATIPLAERSNEGSIKHSPSSVQFLYSQSEGRLGRCTSKPNGQVYVRASSQAHFFHRNS